MMSHSSLRDDALAIWQAGVEAVDSSRLVGNVVRRIDSGIKIAGHKWSFGDNGRICVVGAGKAGAGMVAGFEKALGEEWKSRIFGWVNVPEDCVNDLGTIHLHGARPAGWNEPTEAGIEGTRKILKCVESLNDNDLCVVLISGGGSALLPAPIDGVTLADKQQVTRTLMHAGATIQELNCVRRALSKVKGGGLLRACRAGRLIALIISDVIGDPLETIASGPTVDLPPNPLGALQTLMKPGEHRSESEKAPLAVMRLLNQQSMIQLKKENQDQPTATIPYSNHIIGNNQTAVAASIQKAGSLGYQVISPEFDQPGIAREFGAAFAQRCLKARASEHVGEKLCLISGGEPTVQLAKTDGAQKGGRNQELVLAAAKHLHEQGCQGIAILSGGTDGEDGPTDAAGAVIDAELLKAAKQLHLKFNDYLSVNNSYSFFEQIGGLIKTGPTHTNVMDLRIGLVE